MQSMARVLFFHSNLIELILPEFMMRSKKFCLLCYFVQKVEATRVDIGYQTFRMTKCKEKKREGERDRARIVG